MKTAFVFPGQGSQAVGMGRPFVEVSPEARALFDRAGEILGFDLAALCADGPKEDLDRTVNTQPALLVTSVVAYRELARRGCLPDAGAGHSLGEISALTAAGAIRFEDAVRLARSRGEYMQSAVPEGEGAMAAVLGLDWQVVEEICGGVAAGGVWPANDNAPGQVVIAGTAAAVTAAADRLKEKGARRVIPLAVSGPFHCPLMNPASERLGGHLAEVDIREASWPVYDNATTEPVRLPDEIRESLVRQVREPLRWVASIRRMAEEGVDTFVEVGSGRVLQGLVKKILPEATVLGVNDPDSLETACEALAGASRGAGPGSTG